MNQIIKDIFDIHQVRKNKKQKTKFIEYTTTKAKEMGWQVEVEKGIFGLRNIIVGNPNSAKVIYTAHYDTCAKLPIPNFLTPKNLFIYILYNIAIVLAFLIIAFGLGFSIEYISISLGLPEKIASKFVGITCLILYILMLYGPANKHTANDNTSGVVTLFSLMKNIPEGQKDKVAIIFFDLEEAGLIGSTYFASKHRNIKNNTLVLNFDCVSDGKTMMILAKNQAKKYNDILKEAFESNDEITVDVVNKAIYPSDQKNFNNGVGIASFNKTKGGMLYMNKIHTKKDTVFQKENIEFLVGGAIKIIDKI